MNTLISILQNPAVLFGVGVLVKYFPVLRTFISNRAIPYINMALALLGALLALFQGAVPPPDAVPGSIVFASGYATVIPLSLPFFGGAVSGFLGAVQSAATNAALAYLLNKLTINQIAVRPRDSKQ